MADSNARIARREKVPIPVQDYYSVDEVAALLLGAVGKAVHHFFPQAVSVKGVNDPAPRACAEVDGKNVVCLHLSHQPLNTASISSTSFWLIGLIFATEFAKSTERAE